MGDLNIVKGFGVFFTNNVNGLGVGRRVGCLVGNLDGLQVGICVGLGVFGGELAVDPFDEDDLTTNARSSASS